MTIRNVQWVSKVIEDVRAGRETTSPLDEVEERLALADRAPMRVGRARQSSPELRIARSTDDIDALLPFYRDGLGLEVLYRFADQDGFDGIRLGRKGAPYHFEFTRAHGHGAGRAPTQDNLLVGAVEKFSPSR